MIPIATYYIKSFLSEYRGYPTISIDLTDEDNYFILGEPNRPIGEKHRNDKGERIGFAEMISNSACAQWQNLYFLSRYYDNKNKHYFAIFILNDKAYVYFDRENAPFRILPDLHMKIKKKFKLVKYPDNSNLLEIELSDKSFIINSNIENIPEEILDEEDNFTSPILNKKTDKQSS